MLKRILLIFVSIIYIPAFALCCFSWPVSEDGLSHPLVGPAQQSINGFSYSVDSTALRFQLDEDELPLLDRFTKLKSLDLSGSTCFEAIMAWEDAHPQVDVKYTVTMPNGLILDNSAQSVDLAGLDSAGVAQAAAQLEYLPNISAIDLGEAPEGQALNSEDLVKLRKACPEATITYSFQLLGRKVTLSDENVDLTGLTSADTEYAIQMLSCMNAPKNIELGNQENCSFTWEDIGKLQEACPGASINYSFKVWGVDATLNAESLNLSHITMNDEGAAVRQVLPYMKNLTYLDMDFCNVSNKAMEGIRNDFPNVKVVWRVWFGDCYSVRTDVEKILASKPSKGGILDDGQVDVLKYCTDVKYLDLGHNEAITNLSFVSGMKNLEVLVVALNPLTDISALANCPKLEYVELNSTSVSDLSALSALSGLRHLNFGNCPNLTDISPLYGLTELERLWIGSITPVPDEQVATMQAAAPECEIDTTTADPTLGGWRYAALLDRGWDTWQLYGYFDFELHPRYEVLREQFGYDNADASYAFYWNDPLY